MLVIAALQENQGQPIKASHIVTDVYIKKAIKEEVMSDPVNQLLQIKFDWPRPTSPTNCDDPVHGSSAGAVLR